MKNILKNQSGIAHHVLILLFVIVFAVAGLYWMVSSKADAYNPFIDISSPQCATLKSIPHQEKGIVGLNGTYGNFGKNKCLRKQIKKFDSYSLYVVANYPSKKCGKKITPRQCGIKAGQYNVRISNGLNFGKWWIDVESGPGLVWSSSQKDNVDFLQGMIDAMDNSTHPVGFYTVPSHWYNIVGDAGFQREMWYATGQRSAADAKPYCNRQIGNNTTVIVQYVTHDYGQEIDKNIRC